MDANNWGQVRAGKSPQGTDTGDWRAQLSMDSRQRVVNNIMDTLMRHLLFKGQEGQQELMKIARRFEEKIYTAALSQTDYLRKISLKMLTMESESQNSMSNPLNSSGSNSQNPPDPVLFYGLRVTDTDDWRAQLPVDTRQRIVNKIMDTLKRHLSANGQEGLQEVKKIAVRFEEKIYTAALSQSDYLRKISLKMLTMESKYQNSMRNLLHSSGSNSQNPPDPGSRAAKVYEGDAVSSRAAEVYEGDAVSFLYLS